MSNEPMEHGMMLSNEKKEDLADSLINNPESATLLGKGGFGEVYKVGNMVVKKIALEEEYDLETFEKEVEIWEEFTSNKEIAPFIPKFLGSFIKIQGPPPPKMENLLSKNRNRWEKFRNENQAYKAWHKSKPKSEYYAFGFIIQAYEPVLDLWSFIYSKEKYSVDYTTGYALFKNLVRAFEILHKSGYIHRDIKPGNILIRTEKHMVIPIIIDFGMVCKLPCDDENECASNHLRPDGTPYYLPQNMFSRKNRINTHFKNKIKVERRWAHLIPSFCKRRKGNNTKKIRPFKNIKIRPFYRIATDNYAVGLTLEELFKAIRWTDDKPDKKAEALALKEEALKEITRLKGQVLPYLAAETAKRVLGKAPHVEMPSNVGIPTPNIGIPAPNVDIPARKVGIPARKATKRGRVRGGTRRR
jgi:serine/threonine protein kinase